jgi:hypothetical protein
LPLAAASVHRPEAEIVFVPADDVLAIASTALEHMAAGQRTRAASLTTRVRAFLVAK